MLLIKDLGPDNPAWPGIDPKWVPIIPVTACWDNITGVQFTHTQFPLTMAWAITIHKSQGLTLEKAVIELGPRDFALDLSFVVSGDNQIMYLSDSLDQRAVQYISIG